ncbi:MAG: hypothetical protein P8169_01470 [Chloroflexota bacterium]
MNQNRQRFFVIAISLLFALLLVTQVASAQTKSFSWDDWSADITVLENGDLEVIETQSLNFQGAPFTFGYRTIFLDQGLTGGSSDNISNIAVSENGRQYAENNSLQPGTFRVSRSGDEVTVNWYSVIPLRVVLSWELRNRGMAIRLSGR